MTGWVNSQAKRLPLRLYAAAATSIWFYAFGWMAGLTFAVIAFVITSE